MAKLLNGDRQELIYYIRDLADRMGLKDWQLRLGDDITDIEEKAAGCYATHGSRRATICVAKNWMEWEPGTARHYLVHELIHCHTATMYWAFNNIKHSVTQVMFDTLYDGFNDAAEIGIDSMAIAWAETLPLPPEPKKKKAKHHAASA